MEEREITDLTLTIELDDGRVMDCDVLYCYTIGEQQYIALAPTDEENIEDIYLYRFKEVDGEPVLTCIESDDEYEAAADRFDELLDEEEYDELVEEGEVEDDK